MRKNNIGYLLPLLCLLSAAANVLVFGCSKSEAEDEGALPSYNKQRVAGPGAVYNTDPNADAGIDEITFPYFNEVKDPASDAGEEAPIIGWRVYYPNLEMYINRSPAEIQIIPPRGDLVYFDAFWATDDKGERRECLSFAEISRDDSENIVLVGEGGEDVEWSFTFVSSDSFSLGMSYSLNGGVPTGLSAGVKLTRDEALYGFGNPYGAMNVRGSKLALYRLVDSKSGEDNGNNIISPFFISSRRFGVFVETSSKGVADAQTQENRLVLTFFDTSSLDYRFFFAERPQKALADFTAYTGLNKVPPPWAFGLHYYESGLTSGDELIDTLKTLPIGGAVALDLAWQSFYNNFEFNTSIFPQPSAFTEAALKAGFRTTAASAPFVNVGEPPERPGMINSTPLYEEGENKGYFALGKDGEPQVLDWGRGRGGVLVDLSKEEAFDWWKNMASKASKTGFSGFNLYGRAMPEEFEGGPTLLFEGGRTEATMHGEYYNGYHRAYNEAITEAIRESEAPFVAAESANWGSRKYLHGLLLSDFTPDFDAETGLPAAVRTAINSVYSGFSFVGVAHKAGDASKPFAVRWAQFSALLPYMQVRGEKGRGAWNSQTYDAETARIFEEYALLHARLFPYFYSLAYEAAQNGFTVLTPLFLGYPNDAAAKDIANQFMLGEALMVAPILEEGSINKCKSGSENCYFAEREVYFPAGEWFNWFTGEKAVGANTKKVGAYLDELPLYAVSGAIIPMAMEGEKSPEKAEILEYRVFPASSGSHSLFDGSTVTTTVDYKIEMKINSASSRRIVFTILLNCLSGFQFRPERLAIDGDAPIEAENETALVEAEEDNYMYDKKSNILRIGVSAGLKDISIK